MPTIFLKQYGVLIFFGILFFEKGLDIVDSRISLMV